ncbi:tripartite motif-containing protein 43-like [Sarcophilus harrisii]|uniref:tripartite motif-containing protein 43-like n=1 Tax=Sarcophilus harrisii TaxID=9305 RepID=UPI000273BF6C|nr:tripartite motif-containing protein 43-like [Sarcophilus harrisii]
MAVTGEVVKELQSEITCSICRSYFCEPATIGCGHSFCQACLSSSWRVGAPVFSCPECRQVSQGREIPLVNRRLAELTRLTKELSSKLMQSTEGQSQCVTHKKPFKLFCEEDQTALCVTCCETPEHGAHNISPLQEAAHKYRRELQNIQSHVGKHLKEDEELLVQEEKHAMHWYWMIIEQYCQTHFFLMEKESQFLESLKEEEKASQNRVSQHMQRLQDLIQELKEAGHQANLDLLQDANQLLERSKALLAQRVKPVTPELREYPIPGLIEMLNRFRVDLTLDPRSATSYVIISENLKSAKAGAGWQLERKSPKDYAHRYVFAEQAFSSGKKYWEVDVTQLPQWILGIYTRYLRRKRVRNEDSCASVFLLQCVKKKEYYYLQTYPGALDNQMKGPLPRVGVYLEYSSGTLGFYNVLQSSVIYKFHSIPFTAPVKPIFSPGPPLPGTKPGPMTVCPVDSHFCACCHFSQ